MRPRTLIMLAAMAVVFSGCGGDTPTAPLVDTRGIERDIDNLEDDLEELENQIKGLREDLEDVRSDSGIDVTYEDYAAITYRLGIRISEFLSLLGEARDALETPNRQVLLNLSEDMDIAAGRMGREVNSLNVVYDLFMEGNEGPLLENHEETVEHAYVVLGVCFYFAIYMATFASDL